MTPQSTSSISDRVQLPLSFDVAKMQTEFEELKLGDFTYYNCIPMTGPAHIVDPSIPMPPPADDYADGSWTEWLDTPALKQSPYFKSIIETFSEHTSVTLVRLLRLAPDSVVKEHNDPTLGLEVHKSVIRLTIPILTNDKVEFYLNDTLVPMQPGECWYMDLTKKHRVVNDGSTERVNMTIDMIPNEWVREMILSSK